MFCIVWSSWGDTTPWLKALYTGNAKSMGQYELCTGLTKEDDGLPYGVQFCYMQQQKISFVCVIVFLESTSSPRLQEYCIAGTRFDFMPARVYKILTC